MDTDFVPFGEQRLRAILEGVVVEGDKAEYVALEVKSVIDVSKKGVGIAKVAKFVLGAANRMPGVGQTHFQGYAVMVLGAQQGSQPGVASGIEAHELSDRLRPYLGADGPNWDLARLPVADDREVLFIVVDPTKPGASPFPCHKDFQPQDKQDTKYALQDGALYVRDKSHTRRATAAEVLALFERGKVARTPEVSVTLTCAGSALALHDASEMLDHVVRVLAEQYRKERATLDAQPSVSANSLLKGFNHPFYEKTEPSGPAKPVEELLQAWEPDIRGNWEKTIGVLVGAVWSPVSFTVLNSAASYLPNPRLVLTIHGAYGVEDDDLDDVDDHDVLPPVVRRARAWDEQNAISMKRLRPVWRREEIEWRNIDSDIEIHLTPEALRPGTSWSPRSSDLVVIASDADSQTLRVTWALTAEGFGEQFTGDLQIPIDPSVGVRSLYERYFAAKKIAGRQ